MDKDELDVDEDDYSEINEDEDFELQVNTAKHEQQIDDKKGHEQSQMKSRNITLGSASQRNDSITGSASANRKQPVTKKSDIKVSKSPPQ